VELIGWLLRLVFFVAALWFALQNTAPVALRLSPTQGWAQVPLIFVILGCFVAGMLAGMVALLPLLLRLRRRAAAVDRQARQAVVATPAQLESDRLTEVARQVGAVGGLELDTRTRLRRR
jgi:lipopolysaccharide assembly protein A